MKVEIEKLGCFAAEFNTIAIDDGIAMGHDGMLYSLPSRDIIADSVEYMAVSYTHLDVDKRQICTLGKSVWLREIKF